MEIIIGTVYEKFALYLKDFTIQFMIRRLSTKKTTVDAMEKIFKENKLEGRLKKLDKDVYIEYSTLNEQVEVIKNFEDDEKVGKVYDKYLLEKISYLLANSPLTR